MENNAVLIRSWIDINGAAAHLLIVQSWVESTGAKNWVTIGSVTLFQPSEFMKVSYILMLARCSIWFRQKFKEDSLKNDWKLLGIFALITLPVMVLLGLQKDLGTAMVFSAILAGLILLSGISWWINPSSCYYRCSCIWGVHVNFSFAKWERIPLWFGNGYLPN